MARLARIVVPDYPHHITQRGNRRQDDWKEFFKEGIDSIIAERIRKHEHTGRPLGSDKFVLRLEKKLNRMLLPKKAGRPKKEIQESEIN